MKVARLYHLQSLLIYIAGLSLLLSSPACFAQTTAEEFFQQGIAFYDAKDYEKAQAAFTEAVKLTPDNAQYHHMLGKSHGRIAQQSNWIKAMYLARKTLKEFQIAAELDKQDQQIIQDLIDFHLQAPAFLGGSKKKAEQLIEVLAELQENTAKAP